MYYACIGTQSRVCECGHVLESCLLHHKLSAAQQHECNDHLINDSWVHVFTWGVLHYIASFFYAGIYLLYIMLLMLQIAS